MKDKFFTYTERVSAYADGKHAFEEGRRRDYNPYVAANKDLAGIWWYGWDKAGGKPKRKDCHLTNAN